jgi:dimethylglycine dehydrogenase
MRLAEDRFLLTGSGYLQNWHGRWFDSRLDQTSARWRNISDDLQAVALVGPRSRELLQRLTSADVSAEALPFLRVTEVDLGFTRGWVARLSLSGEQTFEIYAPAASIRPLYERIRAVGEDLGLRDVGIYAILSMRLEKSHGIWSREFSRDYTPFEAGFGRFIDWNKPAFIGREQALRDREKEPKRILATFAIEAEDADAAGYEPIWQGGELVGFVTSGGYGHRTRQSLAMGYVDAEAAASGNLEISILGERRPARLLTEAAYDPAGQRARS